MERSHYSNELGLANVGEKVTLLGWVSKRRNLGSLLFIDLRDRFGIVQIVVNDGLEIPDVRNEYVIQVKGEVAKRATPNPKLKSGEIEVIASEIVLLNTAKTTPLIIADETDALEDTRLKYRYLDLRRPCMKKYFDVRDTIKMTTHSFMHRHHFIEIETRMLCAINLPMYSLRASASFCFCKSSLLRFLKASTVSMPSIFNSLTNSSLSSGSFLVFTS